MKKITTLTFLSLAAIAPGLLETPAWAEATDMETILYASDASDYDTLGQAVAISGNIALVGVDRDDDAGNFSGSAYLFDTTTGEELFKLTASDAVKGDVFGHSVAINGNTAIVGAFGDDDKGEKSGSIYLFDVTTGNETLKLTASDGAAGDQFGHGLAISGNRIIAGSYLSDNAGASSGSAYLFDATTGEELFKLNASDAAEGDWFGYWTAISGNIAMVGSRRDDDAGTNSGSVYLFDVTTGEELMKLTASDAEAGDEFGYAVAIDGNKAIVSAFGSDDAGSNSGSAYVFDVTTGREIMKLTASDAEAGDEFGYAVDISGNTAIVGAYGDNDAGQNSGSAYLYDLTFGTELAKLTASDASSGDEFGTAVGLSGNAGLVGAWRANNTIGVDVGQAYAFDISESLPPGPDFNDDGIVDSADLSLWNSSYPGPKMNINNDDKVDGVDFLLWQQSHTVEIAYDESPANLDNQGPVDIDDIRIWEQAYATDASADLDGNGKTDGVDFLKLQREITPYDAADINHDRLVDGLDLGYWETSFGWTPNGDADGDGSATGLDFLWWQIHASQLAPNTVTSVQVPEPASYLLFPELIVACFTGRKYRRRLRG